MEGTCGCVVGIIVTDELDSVAVIAGFATETAERGEGADGNDDCCAASPDTGGGADLFAVVATVPGRSWSRRVVLARTPVSKIS